MKSGKSIDKLVHRRTSSKRRCLYDFQADGEIDIFQQTDIDLPQILASKIQGPFCCKVLKDRSHGHLLFFTYHYLTLCFNSKDPKQSTKYIDFIYELIEKPEFDLILPEQKNELTQSSTITLKNIISQYLNYMSSNSQPILKSFNKFPAILSIFVYFFYSLLFLGQVCNHYEEKVSMQATYQFLTSYFDMEVSFGNDYAYFLNSNMCVFEESPEEIYIFVGVREKDDHSLVVEQENIRTQNFISTLENISEDSLDALISPRKQSQTKLPHPKYSKIIQPVKKIQNLCQNSDKIESGVSFNYTQSQKTANIDASPCKESLIQFPDPTRQENFKSISNNASIGNNEESQSLHTRSRSEFCQGYSYWSNASTSNGSNVEQNYFKDVKNTHHKYQTSSHFPPKPNKIEINKFSISTPTSFFRPIQAPIPSLCGSPKCWVSKNVTKQYTSSFILQAMPEPYRTSIEFKKKRAREIRKSAYTFLA